MTKKEGTLFRQDTAGSYRSDRLGDTRGVAYFISSDGDVLFPENGTGSGGRLTNGPHPASVLRCWEPLPSRSSREKRKGIRWWGEYAFSVATTESTGRWFDIFCRLKPGIGWHNAEWTVPVPVPGLQLSHGLQVRNTAANSFQLFEFSNREY